VWGFPGTVWGGNSNMGWGLQLPGTPNSASVAGYFQQLRALVSLWKSAQTYYPNIIVCFGGQSQAPGAEFSPWSFAGSGNPDGSWGSWAKIVNGQYVPARVTGIQLGGFDAFADGTASVLPNSYVKVT
jgi:hypothetical protein